MASALNNGSSALGHSHSSNSSSVPTTPTKSNVPIMDAIVVSMDEEGEVFLKQFFLKFQDDSFDEDREDELEHQDFDQTQGDKLNLFI